MAMSIPLRRSRRRRAVAAAAVVAFSVVLAPSSTARIAGTVIHVTTTQQKIGGPGGCSLEEAILVANQDSSIVFDPNGSNQQWGTQCEQGSGADVIELAPGTYSLGHAIDDVANYTGPTATPMITSDITIEGRGARLSYAGTNALRPFRALSVTGSGALDLREVDVVGFAARGGDGRDGGGGGLGAGGAIYADGASLRVQWSTFEGNGAIGGNGGGRNEVSGTGGGGGGGLGGFGGGPSGSGGGGGGSRGSGGGGGSFNGGGGGGGGTMSDGADGEYGQPSTGGNRCGGDGGANFSLIDIFPDDGEDGTCAGGGGGGGQDNSAGSADGGAGAYGGGGGGGAFTDGDGGHGGFGGGGGAGGIYEDGICGFCGGSGGDGGFGGGGGAGRGGLVFGGRGDGGTFGGHGAGGTGRSNGLYGGGGGGLGGAIFAYRSTVNVVNSTFVGNYAVRGVAGGAGAANGGDAGGAIFTVAGTLTVNSSTISGNDSTGSGAGLVVYAPTTGEATALNLYNTIVALNGSGAPHDECFVLRSPAVHGSGNLITPHDADTQTPCPGIVSTDDPLLGSLTANPPGKTPTMALDPVSPAIDAGDASVAPADDQRGILRPQGPGVDIGAYESFAADTTPPTATPTQSPAAGTAGWNTTDVTVTWNWTDESGGSGIDPANCTTSSTSSGEGAALGVSATCSDFAGNQGSATYTVKVDKTGPTVTCAAAPLLTLGGTGSVSATVTDSLSGPAASPVTVALTAAQMAVAGAGSADVTGYDVAGNQTTASCPYLVAFNFLGFLQPIPQPSYKRGSTIPVKFQLGDARGTRISDAAAAALLSPTCLITITLDGAAQGCPTYDPLTHTFQFNVRSTKQMSAGAHAIAVVIKAPNSTATLNNEKTTVVLK